MALVHSLSFVLRWGASSLECFFSLCKSGFSLFTCTARREGAVSLGRREWERREEKKKKENIKQASRSNTVLNNTTAPLGERVSPLKLSTQYHWWPAPLDSLSRRRGIVVEIPLLVPLIRDIKENPTKNQKVILWNIFTASVGRHHQLNLSRWKSICSLYSFNLCAWALASDRRYNKD